MGVYELGDGLQIFSFLWYHRLLNDIDQCFYVLFCHILETEYFCVI